MGERVSCQSKGGEGIEDEDVELVGVLIREHCCPVQWLLMGSGGLCVRRVLGFFVWGETEI